MPLSGATTCVYFRRSCCCDWVARAAARTLQGAGALGVGRGRGRIRLGFLQRGPGLGQVGVDDVGVEHGQHLSLLDDVAHVDAHLAQAQAVRLAADDGFLPGGDVAVRRKAQRQTRAGRARRGHGQGRTQRRRFPVVGGAPAGEHAGQAGYQDGGGQIREMESMSVHHRSVAK
jgi:hypothetical protein